MLKICPSCEKEFKAKGTAPIYCSRKCYTKIGSNNPKWRDGVLHSAGYRYIYQPDHPHATKMGYVLEHRLVMEKVLGRYLEKNEIVHHINHRKSDNDPQNLMVYTSTGRHFINEHFEARKVNGQFSTSIDESERPKHLANLDWLKKQYIDKNRTAQDIADELKCPRATITSCLHKNDIKKR